MKATAHTEVYRRFQGELRPHPLRFWPLVVAHVRVGVKKKLPLLLFYGPPAIATIVFSFVVYGKYVAEGQMEAMGGGGGLGGLEGALASSLARRAMQQLEVTRQIAGFHQAMTWFALLATAWYGSGLFAEDRRVGAHQLYFSRPLTRLDYFLGKLLSLGFFAGLALIAPGLVICTVAAFASPEWSFVTDQPDVIGESLLYGLLWVLVAGLATLAASSLAPRRIFALIGIFAFFVLSTGVAQMLGQLADPAFLGLSPILDVYAVGGWLFGVEVEGPPDVELGTAVRSLAAYLVLFGGIVAWRLRRLEVVA